MNDEQEPAPTAEGGKQRRRLLSRVRIRTKLTAMLLVPALTLTGMVALRLVESAAEAREVGATADAVELLGDVNDAIGALMAERTDAAMLVYQEDTGLAEPDALLEAFERHETETEAALDALETTRSELDLDAETVALLDRAGTPLDRLAIARRAVHDGTVDAVHLTVYNSVIGRLSVVVDRAVDAAGTAELSRMLRTASLLAAIDEHSEQLRLLVLSLEDGKPLAGKHRTFMRLSAAREESLNEYRRTVVQIDPEASVLSVGGIGSTDARAANAFESAVAGSRSDDDQVVDHEALMAAYDARHTATAKLVDDSLTEATEQAESVAAASLRRLGVEGLIAVLALALAILIAYGIGRSVTHGLRELSGSARRIAMVDLPLAVKRVDQQQGLGGLSPFQFAARTPSPLQVQGKDELSEVGEAFNIVHREAIRVSAQQALLRFHVGAIFVRLARRGHSLTGRLTAELDEAERNEQDPDRLQRLFRLDHLASLIGRANDSLLVLGGSSAAKVRTTDAKVGDVLTAAQSRIEYYTRVEVASDEGAWVKADVVDDVVQLLAELMDNATRYSESATEVTARIVTGKVIIQVRDHGIGIETDRLERFNERLKQETPVDLEAMQAMGLTVVGFLASRHGIEIEMRPSIGGGIVVEVIAPGSLLSFTEPERSERMPESIVSRQPQMPRPRTNAPLFAKGAEPPAPAPAPAGPRALTAGPARGVAAVGRPQPELGSAATAILTELPEIKFDVTVVHADPSLRAGHRLPTADPGTLVTGANGLPQRQPMSNLVPGAIAPSAGQDGKPIERNPRSIGATYSAYARGLSGSRTATPTNDK
ncbi:ATP-binding protein [Glycomyces paridis]|uniref:histidine kinase n=1 Tax=Glycomyces paridis TaxID=2126555 RepID=A0A4S8P9R5_9ACTN|nr:ATP-binding protein [Glycomyces paridis]THV24559.1 HAMP domain-containing protein [Glycomyces paridis]